MQNGCVPFNTAHCLNPTQPEGEHNVSRQAQVLLATISDQKIGVSRKDRERCLHADNPNTRCDLGLNPGRDFGGKHEQGCSGKSTPYLAR